MGVWGVDIHQCIGSVVEIANQNVVSTLRVLNFLMKAKGYSVFHCPKYRKEVFASELEKKVYGNLG